MEISLLCFLEPVQNCSVKAFAKPHSCSSMWFVYWHCWSSWWCVTLKWIFHGLHCCLHCCSFFTKRNFFFLKRAAHLTDKQRSQHSLLQLLELWGRQDWFCRWCHHWLLLFWLRWWCCYLFLLRCYGWCHMWSKWSWLWLCHCRTLFPCCIITTSWLCFDSVGWTADIWLASQKNCAESHWHLFGSSDRTSSSQWLQWRTKK